MYAKLNNGAIEKYPFTRADLQAQYPGASVPATWTPEFMDSEGLVLIVVTGAPPHDNITQGAREIAPAFVQERNRWEQQWEIYALSAAEVAQREAALIDDIVQQTQQRLDDFARTRGYDSVLSATTYSDSLVQRFRTEGQYCLAQRDATWAKLYEMLEEVQAGTRPRPTGFEDVEPELPVLVWPQ